jgi:hypothetical protein
MAAATASGRTRYDRSVNVSREREGEREGESKRRDHNIERRCAIQRSTQKEREEMSAIHRQREGKEGKKRVCAREEREGSIS